MVKDERECPCCEACQKCTTDFKKVIEINDAGLVVYLYNPSKSTDTADLATSDKRNVIFIIQNKNDVGIATGEFIPAIDKAGCPRCKHIIERAKVLMRRVPSIQGNFFKSICDHCKVLSESQCLCRHCQHVVKKFASCELHLAKHNQSLGNQVKATLKSKTDRIQIVEIIKPISFSVSDVDKYPRKKDINVTMQDSLKIIPEVDNDIISQHEDYNLKSNKRLSAIVKKKKEHQDRILSLQKHLSIDSLLSHLISAPEDFLRKDFNYFFPKLAKNKEFGEVIIKNSAELLEDTKRRLKMETEKRQKSRLDGLKKKSSSLLIKTDKREKEKESEKAIIHKSGIWEIDGDLNNLEGENEVSAIAFRTKRIKYNTKITQFGDPGSKIVKRLTVSEGLTSKIKRKTGRDSESKYKIEKEKNKKRSGKAETKQFLPGMTTEPHPSKKSKKKSIKAKDIPYIKGKPKGSKLSGSQKGPEPPGKTKSGKTSKRKDSSPTKVKYTKQPFNKQLPVTTKRAPAGKDTKFKLDSERTLRQKVIRKGMINKEQVLPGVKTKLPPKADKDKVPYENKDIKGKHGKDKTLIKHGKSSQAVKHKDGKKVQIVESKIDSEKESQVSKDKKAKKDKNKVEKGLQNEDISSRFRKDKDNKDIKSVREQHFQKQATPVNDRSQEEGKGKDGKEAQKGEIKVDSQKMSLSPKEKIRAKKDKDKYGKDFQNKDIDSKLGKEKESIEMKSTRELDSELGKEKESKDIKSPREQLLQKTATPDTGRLQDVNKDKEEKILEPAALKEMESEEGEGNNVKGRTSPDAAKGIHGNKNDDLPYQERDSNVDKVQTSSENSKTTIDLIGLDKEIPKSKEGSATAATNPNEIENEENKGIDQKNQASIFQPKPEIQPKDIKQIKAEQEALTKAKKEITEGTPLIQIKGFKKEDIEPTIPSPESNESKHEPKHKPMIKSRDVATLFNIDSELQMEVDSLKGKNLRDLEPKNNDVVYTDRIIDKSEIPPSHTREEQGQPGAIIVSFKDITEIEPDATAGNKDVFNKSAQNFTPQTQDSPDGIIRYALSDRSFIEKGWTKLPTDKVVQRMNVYRMHPARPQFDWFERNKGKGIMHYDSGEKLAEIKNNGRGQWFYKNGRLALDYYNAEESCAQQRFVLYSNGEPDERGRSRPITVLGMFDYAGNGVVFDHSGKIRMKYNQSEGVVLDRGIGPVSHWKWHSLNDPPVLQRVMMDTYVAQQDPRIAKLGKDKERLRPKDNEEMLAIEFENFVKEKTKKSSQNFKPFQIKMKALKINENFSLRVVDQATIYLIFKDGTTNLKLNLGMKLDSKEIIDTATTELGVVSNSLERVPARSDSVAAMQRSVEYAQRFERNRTERDRRLRPPAPCVSDNRVKTLLSNPPMKTIYSVSAAKSQCSINSRRPPTCTLYYNSRLN